MNSTGRCDAEIHTGDEENYYYPFENTQSGYEGWRWGDKSTVTPPMIFLMFFHVLDIAFAAYILTQVHFKYYVYIRLGSV